MNTSVQAMNDLKNINLVSMQRNKIFPYSPRNKNVKGPLENSVLNPETNSDSPSERSNGVRLASIKMKIIHMMIVDTMIRILFFMNLKFDRENELLSVNQMNKMKMNTISYEINWLTIR